MDKKINNPKTNEQNIKNSSKIWANVKPFVEGGLAGLVACIPDMSLSLLVYTNKLSSQHYFLFKQVPSFLVLVPLRSTMLFGISGFLTRKLEVSNKGMPLTHYQNFGCSLISGAVGTCVTAPFYISCLRLFQSDSIMRTSIIQDLYCKAANEGILALWKGGSFIGNWVCLTNVGMLAMYNPTYEYLRGSVGLTASSSVLGAGLMSGFFASTCSYPYMVVHDVMQYMKPKYKFTGYLDCAFKMLKAGGPRMLYGGSAPYILHTTTHATVLWYCLEKVKKTEKSFGW